MAGVNVGLSKTRIAHLIGRSPSVVCREIAHHRGPGGVYQAQDAGRAAQAATRRPKKRLLDRDEVLRRRVISNLSQGHAPRQISGSPNMEACGTVGPMDNSPHAQGHTISHEAICTWIYAHPKKTLIEHGICLPSRRWMCKKPPAGGRKPPIVGMRLIDERLDIADRMIPGNWEGDLIIGKDGASACVPLVERTTRYLIIVALPLGHRADQVCDALTRRIHGLPEGALRTLTGSQGPEMARHQRPTHNTGVDVFFAHPNSPWERGTNENTNRLIRRYLPTETPITSHQPSKHPAHKTRPSQLPQSHPRLPHPHRSIQRTHCYHPLTPPALGQIIVVDNIKYMPDITELQSRCNLIYFSKQEGHGRYGFHNDIYNEPSSIRSHPMSNSPTFSYKPMWNLLIDRDMTKTPLQELAGLSPATIAQHGRGGNVTTNVLARICQALNCDVASPNEQEIAQ